MFNAFEEIFAPGRKHTDDERNRLALTRVDVGDGDPGRGPIDLDSGRVTVRASAPAHPDAAHQDAPAADAPAPDATVGPAGEPGAAAGTADAADTADADAVDGPGSPASRRVTPPG